jgi:hypothetical protein
MACEVLEEGVSVICPNCKREAPGLYTSETGVSHCGCYYEAQDPKSVDYHVSTDPEATCLLSYRAIAAFWDRLGGRP